MNLCDFSKFEGKLYKCVAELRRLSDHGSRRRPGFSACWHAVVVYQPCDDHYDTLRAMWSAPILFKSILRSEAEAALAEAQETIAAALEFECMRSGA